MIPTIFAEDEWMAQNVGAALEKLVGPMHSVAAFEPLLAALDEYADDSSSTGSVVILDPGLPGVCRLDAVHALREHDPRATIVVWTGTRDPSFLASAMLDGAVAAMSKQRRLEYLAAAVESAQRGRYTCEPSVAQWFVDFFEFLERCRTRWDADEGTHIWSDAQLARLDTDIDASWLPELEALAAGEALDGDDRWFTKALAFVRSLWLEPHHRQALIALAVCPSRRQAAEAIGKSETTFHSYCSRIAARLMPDQYPADARPRRLTLAEWVIRNHAGCELLAEDHVLA